MHHDELNSRWTQLKSSLAQLKMSSIVSLKTRTDLLFCEMNQVLLKFLKLVLKKSKKLNSNFIFYFFVIFCGRTLWWAWATKDELNSRWAQLKMSSKCLSKQENLFTFLWNESSVVEICLKKSKNGHHNEPD